MQNKKLINLNRENTNFSLRNRLALRYLQQNKKFKRISKKYINILKLMQQSSTEKQKIIYSEYILNEQINKMLDTFKYKELDTIINYIEIACKISFFAGYKGK